MYLTPKAAAALPPGASEAQALWRVGALRRLGMKGLGPDTHPLALYGLRSAAAISLGKGLVDPEHTAAYEARGPCARALYHSTYRAGLCRSTHRSSAGQLKQPSQYGNACWVCAGESGTISAGAGHTRSSLAQGSAWCPARPGEGKAAQRTTYASDSACTRSASLSQAVPRQAAQSHSASACTDMSK